jgi:flagellar hook-associated protein 2
MSTSSLTTSGINTLVNSYKQVQYNRRISPLATRKDKYSGMSSALTTLSSKLTSMKSLLSGLKTSGSTSIFNLKEATSSNEDFITANASKTASKGSYEFFVSQLAKNDLAVSRDMASDTVTTLSGTHSFVIKTGDGATGEYMSNIDVELDGTETNQEVMEAIQYAINSDKAVVESDAKTGTDTYSGGSSTFTIDLNGTETEITVNGGGTYEDLVDELVTQINSNIDGITAEKVTDGSDVQLKLQVSNSDHYVSISHTSGNDIVTDLNIGVTKEKGASGLVTASVFTPRSGVHQLSISSNETGLDNRIKELSDSGTSTALAEIGLNLGTSRPTFDQSGDPDTPGFVYSDITDENNLLNSKFKFNGLDIQKNSNAVEDLVEGMTFNLNSVMQATDNNVNVSVTNDVSEIRSKIEEFISSFNEVYTYIQNQSGSDDGNRGALLGEANSRSLINTLKTIAYNEVTGLDTGALSYLSQVGISFDSSSGLSISDSSLLEQQLQDNVSEVKDLFTSTNGLATTLYSDIDAYLGSDGYLTNAIDSYSNSTSYLDDRIETIQSSIDKSAEVLRNKYQQLQIQYATLLNSSSSLFYGTDTGSDSYF